MKHIQINLNVTIHKVKLQVRFPCSLIANLKVQNSETAFGPEVPLRVGEAYLQLSAAQKVSIFFDANKNAFSEKKISICVYLNTSSGRIPAGAAYILMNTLEKGVNKQSLTIEKCPDKSAFIDASISYQILNEIETMSSTENIPELVFGNPFTLRQPLPNRDGRSIQKPKLRTNERMGLNSPKESNGSQLKSSIKSLERSKVEGYRSNLAIKTQVNEDRGISKNKTGEKSERQEYYSPSLSPSPMIDYGTKLRVGQLEKELKNLQKRYDQSVVELKSVTAKKDLLERSLKESQGQARIFKQKYEDLLQSSDNTQKRNDYKQNSLKEQIKSLSEKLSSSQNEKQLMIFEKNDIVTDFEERQKTLRLTMREKQKQFNEEKNKLVKKNEYLLKELSELQGKLAENDKKLAESSKQMSEQNKKNELLEQKCEQYINQINELKETLVSQRNKREEVEQNMGSNLELQQEKKKLKKKIAQLEQQIGKLNKNIAQIDSNYQKTLKRSEDLQISLKEKTNSLKNLQKDYDGSVKDIESLKKTLEDKERKLEETLYLKQGQSSKIEALNEQFRQSQKKNLEEIKTLKKESQDKERRIQLLLKQNEENVQSINDYNTKVESQEVELQKLKNTFNSLKIQHEELSHSKQAIEIELVQLKNDIAQERLNKEELESAMRKEIREKETQLKSTQQALKKYQNNSSHREEQDAFKIANLQQKIASLQHDIQENLAEIQTLKQSIKQLELEKYHGQSMSDELQYNLKLKGNEIVFLKETVEKNNHEISDLTKENKEMSIKIQKLEDKVTELENLSQNLSKSLNEATENGSGIQQKLANYVKLNNEKISLFLNAFLNGSKVILKPVHQEAEIQVLMQSVITKVNEVYTNFEEKLKNCEASLEKTRAERDEFSSKLQAALKDIETLNNNLEDTLSRSLQNNKNSDSIINDLRAKLANSNKQITSLESEIASLKTVNQQLLSQLDSLNNGFGNKEEQNSSLKLKISDLQEVISQKGKEYATNESRQAKRYEDDTNSLKSKIGQLQQQAKKQALKLADTTTKLNDKTKEYKELQRKTSEEIKKLKSQIQRLNAQIAKQTKQLESKANLNTKYGQIEAELRVKLEQAGKDNAALRELNENIRKRNEKAAQKEKEQDALIFSLKGSQTQLSGKQSDLQKAIKERTAQFVASRQQNFKLEKQKQKLVQDLQSANSMIKVKDQYQKKIQISLKTLEQEKIALKETIKGLESAANQNARKSQKEISLLSETKNKFDKQLEDTKQKLDAAQAQLAKESSSNKQANKQLADEIKELKLKNRQLQDERNSVKKSMQEQERSHSAQDQYLKPIRDHLQSLKGHMAEYSRTGDQFQSNKNKLLKLAATKSQLPNEKYISDRIRDFSNAYNKLKIFILGCKLSEQAKAQAGEQIKKVQSALDKVLRGDK